MPLHLQVVQDGLCIVDEAHGRAHIPKLKKKNQSPKQSHGAHCRALTAVHVLTFARRLRGRGAFRQRSGRDSGAPPPPPPPRRNGDYEMRPTNLVKFDPWKKSFWTPIKYLRVQHSVLIKLMGLMTSFERKFFQDFGPLLASQKKFSIRQFIISGSSEPLPAVPVQSTPLPAPTGFTSSRSQTPRSGGCSPPAVWEVAITERAGRNCAHQQCAARKCAPCATNQAVPGSCSKGEGASAFGPT